MTDERLTPCPHCKDAWLYKFTHHDRNHHFGYTINCKCGYAWRESIWKATEQEAITAWNRSQNEK